MIYLLTRPIVWAVKLVRMIVKLPFKMVGAVRNHGTRKNAKFAAKTIKEQAKAAKTTV